MNYLSSLNRNKVLSENSFIIILLSLLIFSIYNISSIKDAYLNENRYEIIDGTEYKHIYINEKLTEDKIKTIIETYKDFNLPEDRILVDINDLFIVDMISKVYGWDFSKIDTLSEEKIYENREIKILENFKNGQQNLSDKAIGKVQNQINRLDTPIKIGYAEGWKNINEGMGLCILIILIISSIVFVPVFNEDEDIGIDGLINSTKNGKRKINKLRVINSYQISSMIYVIGLLIYTIPIYFIYGLEGGNLPIQSSTSYFLSALDVSFYQQFIINLIIGYTVVLFMTSIVMLISTMIDEVNTGYASIIFIIALSYITSSVKIFKLKHYFGNFLPIQLLNFRSLYIDVESYFGIFKIYIVPVIVVLLTLAILTTIVLRFRIKQKFERIKS